MSDETGVLLSEVGQARQLALVRLLLAFTGHTHQWLLDYGDKAASILRRSYGNPADALPTLNLLKAGWDKAFTAWETKFNQARRDAALISFGELAVSHRHFMGQSSAFLQESAPVEIPPVFEQQLAEVIEAASNRVHGDGFTLSHRIWRLDRDGFNGIKRTVMAGVSEQKSAWELAQDVEQYLGAGADCPRWTATRLYGLTKKDIAAGNRTGLIKGAACAEQGVAYNALRLARTEITYASNDATKTIHERSPWVERVKVNLSPAHPEPDICDDYAQGGRSGNGVYLVGDVTYPPYHPHCLCFVTAVQMSDAEFTRRMRGWLNQTEQWPEMDGYAAGLNRSRFNINDLSIVAGLEKALFLWSFDLPGAVQPYLPGLQP